MFDLCSNIVTYSMNTPCRSFWTANIGSYTSLQQTDFCNTHKSDLPTADVCHDNLVTGNYSFITG